jgi:hypothetical protein
MTENVIGNAMQSFELWLKCSNSNLDIEQTETERRPQDLAYLQGLQEGLAISQLQKPDRTSPVQEDAKQAQGGIAGWANRVDDMIVMMMGLRGLTSPMTRGFIALALAVVIATVYAVLLMMVAGLRWANRS